MSHAIRIGLAALAALAVVPSAAEAGWGSGYGGGPTYFHAPAGRLGGGAFGVGFGHAPHRPAFPAYGGYPAPAYGAPMYGTPTYGGYAAPAYGVPAYAAPAYGAPAYAAPVTGMYGPARGELEYDVYTPHGRQEVEYEFRRNGVFVDYDD